MSKRKDKNAVKAELLDTFIEMLRTWNGTEPTFQEIIVDTAMHCAFIAERTKEDIAFVRDFAEMTGLPPNYVRGWAKGKDIPNTKLAKEMVREIRIFLEKARVPPAERPN